MPTPDQIAQVKTNVNNLMDFTNHVHDFLQDVINEVYLKLSESPSYDPGQKFVTTLLDAAFWSISAFEVPGASVLASFLGTFFGAYSGPNPPPSLAGTFGDVWARFDASFLQANSDLSVIWKDPASNWDKTFSDPVSGKTTKVSDLGDGTTKMPSKDDPKFQQMTDSVVAAYRVSLTRSTIGKKWFILQDMQGVFMPRWTDQDVRNWGHGFIAQNKSYYLTWRPDTGGSFCCPVKGQFILENFLGTGSKDPMFAGHAPDDMCNWLFQDDEFGTVTNANGIAKRKDVFYSWGLSGSLSDSDVEEADGPTPEQLEVQKRWQDLFQKTPRSELETRIARRAWADPLYMRELIRNPRGALPVELGMEIPPGVEVEVVQELPGKYKLVIPWAGRPEEE